MGGWWWTCLQQEGSLVWDPHHIPFTFPSFCPFPFLLVDSTTYTCLVPRGVLQPSPYLCCYTCLLPTYPLATGYLTPTCCYTFPQHHPSLPLFPPYKPPHPTRCVSQTPCLPHTYPPRVLPRCPALATPPPTPLHHACSLTPCDYHLPLPRWPPHHPHYSHTPSPLHPHTPYTHLPDPTPHTHLTPFLPLPCLAFHLHTIIPLGGLGYIPAFSPPPVLPCFPTPAFTFVPSLGCQPLLTPLLPRRTYLVPVVWAGRRLGGWGMVMCVWFQCVCVCVLLDIFLVL